jgi:hypothetical protein
MSDEAIDMDTQRKHLEYDTRSFFSKWYRRFLRWTLRKLIDRADELHDSSIGKSSCGCYYDDTHNTLCLWHELNTYLR